MSNVIRTSSIALVLSVAPSVTALAGCGAPAAPSGDEPVATSQAAVTCIPRYDDPTHCTPSPPAPKGPTPAPTSTTPGKPTPPPVPTTTPLPPPSATCDGVPEGYVCVCSAAGDCSVEPAPGASTGGGDGSGCVSLPDDFICVCDGDGSNCKGLPFEH